MAFVDRKRFAATISTRARSENAAQPEHAVQTRELKTEVEAALSQLEPVLREVVVLRYFSDFDSREIGDMLGIPDSTVRSHLRSARQQLAYDLAAWSPKQ